MSAGHKGPNSGAFSGWNLIVTALVACCWIIWEILWMSVNSSLNSNWYHPREGAFYLAYSGALRVWVGAFWVTRWYGMEQSRFWRIVNTSAIIYCFWMALPIAVYLAAGYDTVHGDSIYRFFCFEPWIGEVFPREWLFPRPPMCLYDDTCP